jgi:hypothetical protein
LLFPIGADLFQGGCISPNTFASRAFAETNAANHNPAKIDPTTRTQPAFGIRGLGAIRARAAMGTKLFSDEHHSKTGWAGNGGKPCTTVLAMRGVTGSCGSAHGTIKGFSGHARNFGIKRGRWQFGIQEEQRLWGMFPNLLDAFSCETL